MHEPRRWFQAGSSLPAGAVIAGLDPAIHHASKHPCKNAGMRGPSPRSDIEREAIRIFECPRAVRIRLIDIRDEIAGIRSLKNPTAESFGADWAMKRGFAPGSFRWNRRSGCGLTLGNRCRAGARLRCNDRKQATTGNAAERRRASEKLAT
jgi:hypothetical protein